MSKCLQCGFEQKPSHAVDWLVPHQFCSNQCIEEYDDAREEVEEKADREEIERIGAEYACELYQKQIAKLTAAGNEMQKLLAGIEFSMRNRKYQQIDMTCLDNAITTWTEVTK